MVHWSAAPFHSQQDCSFGCAIFCCWLSLCVPLTNSLIECYFIMMVATIIGRFMAILFYSVWTTHLGTLWLHVGSSDSANTTHLPGCFCPWAFSLNIGLNRLITFGLLCVIFRFSIMIFYKGVPGFAIDCPCNVWCRGLTTCLLYLGPLFWKHILEWVGL